MRDFVAFKRNDANTLGPKTPSNACVSIEEIEISASAARVGNYVNAEAKDYLGYELTPMYASLCELQLACVECDESESDEDVIELAELSIEGERKECDIGEASGAED